LVERRELGQSQRTLRQRKITSHAAARNAVGLYKIKAKGLSVLDRPFALMSLNEVNRYESTGHMPFRG
jgi:hypothetical protein